MNPDRTVKEETATTSGRCVFMVSAVMFGGKEPVGVTCSLTVMLKQVLLIADSMWRGHGEVCEYLKRLGAALYPGNPHSHLSHWFNKTIAYCEFSSFINRHPVIELLVHNTAKEEKCKDTVSVDGIKHIQRQYFVSHSMQTYFSCRSPGHLQAGSLFVIVPLSQTC